MCYQSHADNFGYSADEHRTLHCEVTFQYLLVRDIYSRDFPSVNPDSESRKVGYVKNKSVLVDKIRKHFHVNDNE